MSDYDPNCEDESREDSPAEAAKAIEATGSVTTEGRHFIHCLTIIGQVEGHYILPPQNKTTKYEHVIPQAAVSLVLGGGHSIGVPLAVSARQSFIVPSATMTIHPVRMNGLVLGVPQSFSYFQKMQDRIVRFVTDNSRISEERFRELMMATGELAMDVGTSIDGETAVSEGLIDNLGGLSDAIQCLYRLIEETGEGGDGHGTGDPVSSPAGGDAPSAG